MKEEGITASEGEIEGDGGEQTDPTGRDVTAAACGQALRSHRARPGRTSGKERCFWKESAPVPSV